MLNARIRKRWRAGNFPIALIGEKVDLTYPYDYLGAGTETPRRLSPKSKFAEALKAAEHPLIMVGAGALARPDGAAIAALAAKAAIEFGALKDGWNGYSRPAHAPRPASARLDLGFVPGAGGLDRGENGGGRRRRAVPARRRRDRRARPGAFVVYLGTHGDRGAASRRRDLARRRLSGKIGALRQHRRPRADGQPRRVPAGRRARGLGDPARAFRRARQDAALDSLAATAPGAVRVASALHATSTRSRPAMPPISASSPSSQAAPTRRRSYPRSATSI